MWIDGSLVEADRASVSVYDHGLSVGDGAFETLKVVNGVPFAAGRHIRRLHGSLDALAIQCPAADVLRSAMAEVVAANGVVEGRVRLTVTAGLGPLGSGSASGPPTVVVAAEPGTRAVVDGLISVPWTRNERSALAGLKTTSYAENVRALRVAQHGGAGEALFTNTRGELCEGTGTNLFLVIDGRVVTPPVDSGCLAGITRELLMEVFPVTEQPLVPQHLDDADEVFLTSSTRDVQGVSWVDDRRFDCPGPVTVAAAEAFAALVATDLDP